MPVYGPGYVEDATTAVTTRLALMLGQLIDNLTAGQYTPADDSVTDAKVAAGAAIAQSKIAGLVDAINALIPLTQKGAANGVATLGADSKIPGAQLPSLAIGETFTVASQAAMLALTAQRGDIAVRTDLNPDGFFLLTSDSPTTLADWVQITAPGGVVSVNGQTGAVDLSGTYVQPATITSMFSRSAHSYVAQYGYTSAAIQAAVDDAVADAATWGQEHWHAMVPPGAWSIDVEVRVPTKGHLQMDKAARLTLAPSANCDIITNANWQGAAALLSDVWAGEGDEDIEISGGFLDGNRTNQGPGLGGSVVGDGPGVGDTTSQSLITLVNVKRPHVHGVYGKSAVLHGIDLGVRDESVNTLADPGCTEFFVTDCHFEDCGDDGVTTHYSSGGQIMAGSTRNAAASYSGASNGVEIDDGSYDVTVSNWTAYNCINGFQAQGHQSRIAAHNVTFNGCIAIDCVTAFTATAGTLSTEARTVTFAGCTAIDCNNASIVTHYRGVRHSDFTFSGCIDTFDTTSSDSTLTGGIVYEGGQVHGASARTLFTQSAVGDVTLRGVTWREVAGTTVVGIGKDNVTLEGAKFIDCPNISVGLVQVYNGARNAKVRGMQTTRCAGSNGVYVVSAGAGLEVTGNDVAGCTGSAGAIFIAAQATVPSGVIRNNTGDGVYGFRCLAVDVDLLVDGNNLTGTTANLNIGAGTGQGLRLRDNPSFPSRNDGVAVIGAAATSTVVPHGLPFTPVQADIKIWTASSLGSAASIWVSNITSTTFTINANVAPGGSGASVAWEVNALMVGGYQSTNFRAHTVATDGSANVASLSPATPAGVVAGDILIGTVTTQGTVAVGAPAGWTLVRDDASGATANDVRVAKFWRLATAAEPANHAFTLTPSGRGAASISAFTGVDAVAPIAAHGGTTDAVGSTTVTTPTITTTQSNQVIVANFAAGANVGYAQATGMTERYETGTIRGHSTNTETRGSVGATGTRTSTIGATPWPNVGQIIALKRAARV